MLPDQHSQLKSVGGSELYLSHPISPRISPTGLVTPKVSKKSVQKPVSTMFSWLSGARDHNAYQDYPVGPKDTGNPLSHPKQSNMFGKKRLGLKGPSLNTALFRSRETQQLTGQQSKNQLSKVTSPQYRTTSIFDIMGPLKQLQGIICSPWLLKGNVFFTWGTLEQESLDEHGKRLESTPILKIQTQSGGMVTR